MKFVSVSSSWSAGDGKSVIEAVVFTAAGRKVLYQSQVLPAELHETERDRVCRALRSLNQLGRLGLQTLALEPGGLLGGLEEQFNRFLAEED
jgi:hypothetical protein